jgi:hypothetical protein
MWRMMLDTHSHIDLKTSVYVGNDAGRPDGWDSNPLTPRDNSDGIPLCPINPLYMFLVPYCCV